MLTCKVSDLLASDIQCLDAIKPLKNRIPGECHVYFVGIKGTGVCPLAELMHKAGYRVSGSDIPEEFYTDKILKKLNIPFFENFDAVHISGDISLVIHSAAYSAGTNCELAKALELDIPVLKYTDALGAWSSMFDSTGICGVHGKTTTTAMCGVLAKAAGLPAQILVGSAVLDFDEMSTFSMAHASSDERSGGSGLTDKYFIAETCEYRKHFLSFHPKRIILTSVESDHQDFFPTYESIRDAFVEYCGLLPEGGQLFYCADDAGAREVAAIIEKNNQNKKIDIISYGFNASGDYKINSAYIENARTVFSLAYNPSIYGDEDSVFKLSIPGRHEVLNAAAALALTIELAKNEKMAANEKLFSGGQLRSIKNAIENFKSAKRRSEIIGEADGIIFMDDYGHHPTAIKTTLEGIKSFYPGRRLIVSFMSHTYTRTASLLEEFAGAFNDAEIVFFHKIYASARENYKGGVNGKTLFERASSVRKGETYYVDEYEDAFGTLCEILKSGDIFLTLGAGNNWPLGVKLYNYKRGYHD